MKYLICGNYGVGNIGDECIARGISNLLTAHDRSADIEILGKGNLLPIGVRSFVKSLFFFRLWKRPLARMKACDHFILGGGGLFTDEERPLTGFFWAMHGLVASILMRKPVTVLGVSFGPMGILSRLETRILCRVAARVYCRDEYSVALAKKYGAKNAMRCPDMAVYYNQRSTPVDDFKKSDSKTVFFILRDYKSVTKNMITNFVRLINHLCVKRGYNITFVDFQNDSNNPTGLLNKIIAQSLSKNKISVLKIKEDLSDLSAILHSAHFIFSMRFHGALLACIGQIPFISINYMAKSSNFWGASDILSFPLSDFSSKEFVVSQFDAVLEERTYRKTVERMSAEYKGFSKDFMHSFSCV